MKKSILILFLGITFFSCQSDNKHTTPQKETTKKSNDVKSAAHQNTLPPMPSQDIKTLWDRCDYIDYLFFNTDFTLSQDDKASIQQFVSFLSNQPAKEKHDCESLGRVFFQEKGEILYEADFYFKKGCTYLEFLENNKPKWHNELTPQGIKFFLNLFKKAQSGNY